MQSDRKEAITLRGGGGASTARKRVLAYLEWTSNAVRMLGNQVSNADLERLVLTKRYETREQPCCRRLRRESG